MFESLASLLRISLQPFVQYDKDVGHAGRLSRFRFLLEDGSRSQRPLDRPDSSYVATEVLTIG